MSVKGEAGLLQKWVSKGTSKGLGKEPPKQGEVPYSLDEAETPTRGGRFEQLNLKVPKGTRIRLKRLGLEQGGLSMVTLFGRMLDEYEARHHQKQKR